MTETKITAGQFFSWVFLSRIFGLLTYINGPAAPLSAENGCLLCLSYFPSVCVFSVPVLLLSARAGLSQRLQDGITRRKADAVVLFIYGLFFLLQAALGGALLDRFIGETMFQSAGHPALFGVFFLLTVITAQTGMQTPARAAPPLLALTLVSFCLIAAATVSYFDPANLSPPAQTDPMALAKNGAFAAMRTAEPAGLLFLSPQNRKKKSVPLALSLFALGATVSLLFTLIAGVTGKFGETQTFQLFTLTTLAELGTVERMDDLLCAIWVFCAFLRTVFYLCLSFRCFCPDRSPRPAEQAGAGMLLFILYLSLTGDTFLRRWFEENDGNVPLCAVFVFIIPLAVFLCSGKARKRRSDAE